MALIYRRIFGRGLDSMGALSRPIGQQIPYPNAYNATSAAPVTVDTALQLSSVWACCKILSESLGSLPLKYYDVKRGVYTENTRNDITRLFDGKVNQWQNRNEFFQTQGLNFALRGNCYGLKQFNALGTVIGVQPLIVDQMDVVLLPDGSIVYQYQDGAETKIFAAQRIWHTKGMGNGLIGLAPLDYMRNSVGIGIAAEDSVSNIYRNGAKPGGILTIDRLLKKEQRDAIKQNFKELAEGDAERLLVLEADMKYQQVKMTPLEIELLSTRKWQVEDICRFFGVPKEMIGATDQASSRLFSDILWSFYKTGLRPMLQLFEESLMTALLPVDLQGKVKVEFDVDEFLRLSEPELVKMLGESVKNALSSPDEARARRGDKPMPGGDNLFMQQQMFPISRLADPARQFPGGNRASDAQQTETPAAE